jgi:hypothetical protein
MRATNLWEVNAHLGRLSAEKLPALRPGIQNGFENGEMLNVSSDESQAMDLRGSGQECVDRADRFSIQGAPGDDSSPGISNSLTHR